ncbi:MAG: DUF3179 domain-containing protein [Chloroflexi bacterium]|nr:DUF3179 domain-containing protein [Chloroflexota bacterium]
MGNIIGKSSTIIIILLVALVAAVIFMPKIGQFFLNFRGETVTIADASARGTPGSNGTRDVKIVTILGRDGIPAILEPEFGSRGAGDQMRPEERVIGVSINGDSRAYPLNMLSRHEIVNDTVGGKPIAVTW